jgi:uncharacterized membrane protein
MSESALDRRESLPAEGRFGVVRRRLGLEASEETMARRLVYGGMAAYAVLFAFAAALHYAVVEELRFDLGNMVQAIWSTLHGHFLETTTQNGFQHVRLGFHVDPFLLLLVPLFWLWPSPLLLLVLQAVVVATGALPVFWLARKHLGSPRSAVHCAFAYLLYPATQFNAFTAREGFHSISLAVPLVLFAVWFLDEDRLVLFSLFALLAAGTKEEMPLAVGCLGIWYAVRKGQRLFGFGVFAVGLALTLFNFLLVIPYFSPNGSQPYGWRYASLGGSPQGMARKLFTDPVAFVHVLATGNRALYLGLLLFPFLGLWAFEPLLLLGAVPDLAINLLSNKSDQVSIPTHWTAGIVPFVVAASIFGAARIKARGRDLSLAVLACCASVALFSPIYGLGGDVRAVGSPLVSAKLRAVGLIPAAVPVSASAALGSRLSERRHIYLFPYVRQSRWIAVDLNDRTYQSRSALRRVVQKYEDDRAWRIVFSSRGVVVLERTSRVASEAARAPRTARRA